VAVRAQRERDLAVAEDLHDARWYALLRKRDWPSASWHQPTSAGLARTERCECWNNRKEAAIEG